MIEIRNYDHIDLSTELKLQLFLCGSAKVDNTWKGSVVCSSVSRLYYIKSGSFFLVVNGQRTDFTKGHWYLVPAGTSYEFGCDTETEQLFFHFNLLASDQIDIFRRCATLLSLNGNSLEAGEIAKLLDSNTDIALLTIKNTLLKLLLIVIKEHGIDTANGKYSPCVIKAINYISENLSENLTIKSISNTIFVSESTLTKHFRSELNTSVNRYIDDLILTRAAQMITESSLSLSAISEHFGFCDQFYFSRKFKAKFGLAPREYKNLQNI